MKFSFSLHQDWETVAGGVNPVFMRRGRANQNALQFSLNESASGQRLGPNPDFKGMARGLAERMGGRPKSASARRGAMGQIEHVVFDAANLAYGELWLATDNVHLAVATFCCDERPSTAELREVEEMVASITWQ